VDWGKIQKIGYSWIRPIIPTLSIPPRMGLVYSGTEIDKTGEFYFNTGVAYGDSEDFFLDGKSGGATQTLPIYDFYTGKP
jgi:hypothetical protein